MSFYTALTGLNGSQADISASSNNIANVGTTGFKRSRAEFGDIFATSPLQNASSSIGSGTILKGIKQQFTQGNIAASLNALDLAISGTGFFSVIQGDQLDTPFFTRDGSFNITAKGEVVTNDGLKVMGYLGDDKAVLKNLIIPTTKQNPDQTTSIISNINVASNGKITATYGLDDEVIIGSFALASFINGPGLTPTGNNRFQNNLKSGLPKFGIPMDGSFGKMNAGYLERANVDITSEMVTMLKTQQAFSGVSRLLPTEVDIAKRLIDG